MFFSYKWIDILVIAVDIEGDNSIQNSEAAIDAKPNSNVVNEMNKSSAEFASAKFALVNAILHLILK